MSNRGDRSRQLFAASALASGTRMRCGRAGSGRVPSAPSPDRCSLCLGLLVGGNAMELRRRTFLHLATGAAVFPAVARMAWAESYPSRPVRILVGYAPGGVTDIIARLIGPWLSQR